MRFGLKISDHDLGVKMKKVDSFLDAGHKVKITAFFRGRELAHKDLGFKIAERVISDFGDSIVVDQAPQLAGKQLSFVVRSSGTRNKENTRKDAAPKDSPSKSPSGSTVYTTESTPASTKPTDSKLTPIDPTDKPALSKSPAETIIAKSA